MTKSLDNKLLRDKIQEINLYVNNNMSRMQEVDLTFLIFIFLLNLLPFILFLELVLKLEY